MADNFFETKTDEAPTTIKVGEKEYSQEELSKIVGLGKPHRNMKQNGIDQLKIFIQIIRKSLSDFLNLKKRKQNEVPFLNSNDKKMKKKNKKN